jgi:hypothetical protein
MPGLTENADGWIDYTDPVSSTLSLADSTTTTITGTADADGGCDFTESAAPALGAESAFEEEVAFNPSTCQEQVLTGGLDTSDEATLESQAAANWQSAADSNAEPATGSAAIDSSGDLTDDVGDTATPSSDTASPDSLGWKKAYEKNAYVDPLQITITSLAANLEWDATGNLDGSKAYGRNNAYEFKYDGWSNSGTPPVRITRYGLNDVENTAGETFKNTDFEEYLSTVLDPAIVWAACGFTYAAAVFSLKVSVWGSPSGTYGHSYDSHVSGGCSDLVHFDGESGSGWTS